MQPLSTIHGTGQELTGLDQVHLTGVQATGFHGVLATERAEGQSFSVDATLFLTTGQAAVADDLGLTVNYAHVAQAIVAVIEGPAVNLIETLAERIAAVVLENDLVYGVSVIIHKPQAPIPVPFQDVQVRISRSRANPPTVSRPFTESLIAPVSSLPGWEEEDPALTQTTVMPLITDDLELTTALEPTSPEVPEIPAILESTEILENPVVPEVPAVFEPALEPVEIPVTVPEVPADPVLEAPFDEGFEGSGQEAEEVPLTGNDDVTQLIPVVPAEDPVVEQVQGHPQIIEPSPESLAIYQALRAEVLGTPADHSEEEPGLAVEEPALEEPAPESPAITTDLMDRIPLTPARVVLALGANLGNAQETLAAAVTALGQVDGFELVKTGPLARTGAVGGPQDQPDFLNTVVIGRTTLSPRQLLAQTQQIENDHGRVRTEHWGPRTLDIDIIDYESVVGTTPDLELPHPRANQRAFVLVPWEVMEPEDHLPGLGGGPVAALAATAPDREGIRWVALQWLDH